MNDPYTTFKELLEKTTISEEKIKGCNLDDDSLRAVFNRNWSSGVPQLYVWTTESVYLSTRNEKGEVTIQRAPRNATQ
jgi:hypothetical protein